MIDNLLSLINFLAWVLGVIFTIFFLICLYMLANYSDLHKAMDELRGIRRTFPIHKWFVLALICWAWVFFM